MDEPMISINKVSIFAEGLDHSECVTTHPDGSIWAGGEAGQIYRISPDGKKVKEVACTGGFILGLAFSPDASWLAICDVKKQCLFRLDMKTGKLRLLARGAGKERFSIPNHLVFACDGNLYVSDSGTFGKANGKIFRFDCSGRGKVWHPGPFNFTNGLVLSPAGDALFVACTWLPGVERIPIRPDGSAGRRSVYVKIPKTLPDGLAFDQQGNLYVSCYTPCRIFKITPKRSVQILLDDWEAHTLSNPTNVVFGGKRFDQMYIANIGRWHIARIALNVRGVPLACHPERSKS